MTTHEGQANENWMGFAASLTMSGAGLVMPWSVQVRSTGLAKPILPRSVVPTRRPRFSYWCQGLPWQLN